MTPSFDTNCLLRWVLEDIPAQAQLVDDLLNRQEVHVADEVIVEMAFVLEKTYRLPRTAVSDYIQLVLTHQNIICDRALFNAVLSIYIARPALSFVDCCLAIRAGTELKTPLYTFDKKLALQMPQAELLS